MKYRLRTFFRFCSILLLLAGCSWVKTDAARPADALPISTGPGRAGAERL